MALKGEAVPTARLYSFGLISRLVEPGAALAEAIRLARAVMQGGPLAIAATKQILVEQQDLTL